MPKREDVDPLPTKSLNRVMQRAIWHVQASQTQQLVKPIDALVAIFKEERSYANELIQSCGVDILSVTVQFRFISVPHMTLMTVPTSLPINRQSPSKIRWMLIL